MDPTAKGRGSTSSRAPYCRAATTPAPYDISPCVSVGPSSTTSTRLPLICSGAATETRHAVSRTVALGLCFRMLSRKTWTSPVAAVSTLLITTKVGISGIVSEFVSGTMRVGNHDLQVGNIKGRVIVAAIPQDQIGFLLSLADDLF